MNKYSRLTRSRNGFSLLELFIVIAIFGILIGMFLPAVRRVRPAARRSQCMNNARQLMLSMLNYENAHGHMPAAMGSPDLMQIAGHPDASRISGWVAVLPFLEENSKWETITKPMVVEGLNFSPFPSPKNADYPPWQSELQTLMCPSAERAEFEFGQSNYAFCIGDVSRGIHSPAKIRGAFACGINTKLDQITDGTSNTIGIAEICNSVDRSVKGNFGINRPVAVLDNPRLCLELADVDPKYFNKDVQIGVPGRGGCWADGAAGYSLFNTILPPNTPSASTGPGPEFDGIYSTASSHVDIIVAAYVDGSTHSIPSNIDTGDSSASPPTDEALDLAKESPFGVWGALGTANGGDLVDHF